MVRRMVILGVLAAGMVSSSAQATPSSFVVATPAKLATLPAARASTSGFRIVDGPAPAGSELLAVSASGPNDAWAVGYDGFSGGLFEHWDGAAWTLVPTGLDTAYSVAALSPHDAWAVVGVSVAHWNGRRWRIALTPLDGGFAVVFALARNDVWAGGGRGPDDERVPLLWHWDGTSWTEVAVPTHPDTCGGDVGAISAVTDSDLWLLEGGGCIGGNAEVAPLHWDGQSWTALENCGRAGDEFSDSILNGVYPFGAAKALMVGSSSGDAVALRYARRCRTLPLAYTTRHQLVGISGRSGHDAWAVGDRVNAQQQFRTLIEHWDGTAWTDLGGPNLDPDRDQLTAVATVPHTPSMTWAVGIAGDRDLGTLRALILLHP